VTPQHQRTTSTQHPSHRSPLPSNPSLTPNSQANKPHATTNIAVTSPPIKSQKKDLLIIKNRLKQKDKKLLSNDMDEDFLKAPWLCMLEFLNLPPFQGTCHCL
jgi:hypothetical protein